jgi:hypothetical protein
MDDDNKNNVIDMFSREELTQSEKSFYDRWDNCYCKTINEGICKCDICNFKRETAYKLILQAKKECNVFMQQSKNKVYWADLLDLLITASKEVRDFINIYSED